MRIKKHVLFWLILLPALCTRAQPADSLSKRDTLALYKKIKKFAYRHKITALLYHYVFVDPAPLSYEVKPLSDNQKSKDPNLRYKGKIIHKITVRVYDPFGYSVNDTTKRATSPIQSLGNKFHIATRQRAIRNLLLFKMNDAVDLDKINESERLIRNAGYINDARIYIEKTGKKKSDSVDVVVVVHDKWPIEILGILSTTDETVTLVDRNLFGMGHQFEQSVNYNFDGNYKLGSRYRIANLSNSFISSLVFYNTSKDITQTGFSLDRPFYSPLAKWAGGLAVSKTWDTFRYIDTFEKTEKQIPLDYYNSDVWLAGSINTGGKISQKLGNMVVAIRNTSIWYEQRPPLSIDTNRNYSNTSLLIGSFGFSLSKFYKDQYIFRFGANEDIPEGLIVRFLPGIEYREFYTRRYYTGTEVSYGKYFDKIGYFSVYSDCGFFFDSPLPNNTTINMGLTYFTDILKIRNWYFRRFVYLKYVNGFNKAANEKITLRPDELYGFEPGSLAGSAKMLLNFEGVAYSPYNILGFRFAPLILMGFGMLETETTPLFNGRLYQAYAIGLLFRNENLLKSSFRITLGFYPYLPGNDKMTVKFNPVTSFILQFGSFSISRPSVTSYN